MRSLTQSLSVLILLAGWLLVFPGSAVVMSGASNQHPETDVTVVPYVTSTTYNSTIIRWYPHIVSPDNLLYANESYYIQTGSYDHSVIVNKTSPMILLIGLDAGTRYHYSLQSGRNTIGNQSS